MKAPVMILNAPGDKGQLKASILCDRLTWTGVKHLYERVGVCHTVTVEERDVPKAMEFKENLYRAESKNER